MKNLTEHLSKRAAMLQRVLDCINTGAYDDQRRYIIFGSDIDEILEEATTIGYERDDTIDSLFKAASDVKTHEGRKRALRRTSLDLSPQLKRVRGASGASTELVRALEKLVVSTKRQMGEENIIDDLDAFYAHEVLAKLPKIVARASSLDSIELPGVPDKVRQYFEEAHHCFLYGFRVACAVLCRAVLESALKQTVDPNGRIEKKVPQGNSYFKALVENAKSLKNDHPICALDVKQVGDWAIHKLADFNRTYEGERLGEVVGNARKVLVDLYSPV